jgi:alkanesulfonate monooxygenase SsuD/methylene tetrahydromethanopterin reductase-like flavin-dependent oxidoreductase (luciferase family)
MGQVIFSRTKNLNVGAAVRNILCNGGPIAHVEQVKTFLTLHALTPGEERRLDLGLASGRFPFSNIPFGIFPRNPLEEKAWPALKGKIFEEALEIFLRLLKGEEISCKDIRPKVLAREDFRNEKDWEELLKISGKDQESIAFEAFWPFPKVGVVPREASLDLLNITLGSHDARTQIFANTLYPCRLFNLSITSGEQIEAAHQRMEKHYSGKEGWSRDKMPRTVLVFVDDDREKARTRARRAHENYMKAIENTLDPEKIKKAVDNSLAGTPEELITQMRQRFHPEDRLMCWFDFNDHDSEEVMKNMKQFMEEVAPLFMSREEAQT